jgi:hypothetical protein
LIARISQRPEREDMCKLFLKTNKMFSAVIKYPVSVIIFQGQVIFSKARSCLMVTKTVYENILAVAFCQPHVRLTLRDNEENVNLRIKLLMFGIMTLHFVNF